MQLLRVFLLLPFLLATAVDSGTSSPVINKICTAVTTNNPTTRVSYDYCVSTLSADPAAGAATGALGLAAVAANLTAAHVTSTLHVLVELIQDLGFCLKYYRKMEQQVAGALADIRAGRAGPAAGKLFEARLEPDFCDMELFEGNAAKNPLSKENIDAGNLAGLADDITQLLLAKKRS